MKKQAQRGSLVQGHTTNKPRRAKIWTEVCLNSKSIPLTTFLLPHVPMVSPGVCGGNDMLNTYKVVILINDRIHLRDDITCPKVKWYSCLENKRNNG